MRGLLLLTFLWLGIPLAGTSDDGNWPSFRGPFASGVAEGPPLPESWNVETGEGILFRVAIPGLAHSSPIIWGDRIFLTTAVSSDASVDFKPGLYGSGEASPDRSEHEWQILCLDKLSGNLLWQKTAKRGRPQDKRHVKATYANSTPATDGKHVVAFFGSEGLFCFSTDGEPLWQRDLGRLDVGAYDLPSYEWGSASSPIIHDGRVFVQCDTQADSFLVALEASTGEVLWRTPRDELPSWGTPTLFPGDEKNAPELITNGSHFIRAYDPVNGQELWRLGGSSKITAPTPVFADGIIIVASGRAPERPIFAIRPGGKGDISHEDHLAWSLTRRGPYMPTPLIYQGNVYVLNNDGPFACYDLKTGAEHYYLRLPHRGDGFSASPVASNGKLYLSSENGEILVVKAGETFAEPSSFSLGEPLMATPAISNGVLYVRGSRHLIAVGKRGS
ncbi:MAG: PQQ-binding-like beta-propeller repeat protein [Verrucomicrobiae bacterium]|nr:PQQ-binding-like beta-propeller repeat protein [Verrucomicrobiae bacterium]